jgi:protein SCO1/2
MTSARLSPHGTPIGKRPRAAALAGALLAAVALSVALAACDSGSADALAPINNSDCLPHIVLTDQTGKAVDLASLKGNPTLIDFIYTSCPGPCQMMTAKMARVADRLGPELGSKVAVVSVTIDPEHDHPEQLADYAKKQGADRKGWIFLTGTPDQIESLLKAYKLERVRDSDGTVEHIIAFFLLGPDGLQRREYNPNDVKAEDVAQDVNKLVPRG